MTFEDNNGAIDAMGNVTFKPSDQFSVVVNWNTGPQNSGDNGHYRTVIDPIINWSVTKELTLSAEGLYIYDGGLNAASTGSTHSYGDVWAGAFYASYVLNDYVTLNGRVEAYHSSAEGLGGVVAPLDGSLSVYSITLGTTITPVPDNSLLKNLSIRPEVRYDFSDSSAHAPFATSSGNFKDELVFAADIIFKF